MKIKLIDKDKENNDIFIIFEYNDNLFSLQKKISKSIKEINNEYEPQTKFLIDTENIIITHTIYYYDKRFIELSNNPFQIIYIT
jgi:hypothetical protein